MWEKISKILKGPIVTSIIYIIFGACLVCIPGDMINMICKFVFGILLIAVGLYHILIYVAEKLKATVFDLFSGGILLVVGIFLFTNTPTVIKLLPVLLGTFVLVDSLWKLKGAIRLRKRTRTSWKVLLIGSLIFIGLGIALIVNPFSKPKYMAIFAGCIFLANGIVDIIFLILVKKGMKARIRTEEESEDLNEEEEPDAEELTPPEPEYAPWSKREEVWREAREAEEASEEDAESAEESDLEEDADKEDSEEEPESEEEEDTDSDEASIEEHDNEEEKDIYESHQDFHVTNEDLSDTKDEKLFSFLRKNKDSEEKNN